MKDCGLGTPATRAAIIETLITREYILRDGKSLEATDKGIRLIAAVHSDVKSPAMTGQWEARLHAIHRGESQLPPFMKEIESYVREVVKLVLDGPRATSGTQTFEQTLTVKRGQPDNATANAVQSRLAAFARHYRVAQRHVWPCRFPAAPGGCL